MPMIGQKGEKEENVPLPPTKKPPLEEKEEKETKDESSKWYVRETPQNNRTLNVLEGWHTGLSRPVVQLENEITKFLQTPIPGPEIEMDASFSLNS